jgi:dihydrofolate reductase
MKKIIVFNMVSLDGFFAGVDGNINWHNVDKEFNEFAIKQTAEFGTLIFGRKTYDLMAGYWPSEETIKNDPIVAGLMNNTPKIIFSRNLQKAEWSNTELVKEIKADEIKKLKTSAQKDLAIFGSGQIVREFTRLGLIDEYRLMVNPVILGSGKPLFTDPLKLKLLKSREFKNGNILLTYEPINN